MAQSNRDRRTAPRNGAAEQSAPPIALLRVKTCLGKRSEREAGEDGRKDSCSWPHQLRIKLTKRRRLTRTPKGFPLHDYTVDVRPGLPRREGTIAHDAH
jgi:hypothetical protein